MMTMNNENITDWFTPTMIVGTFVVSIALVIAAQLLMSTRAQQPKE